MATAGTVALKRGTAFRARWAPTWASHADGIILSWVDRDASTVCLARTEDLQAFEEVIDLGVRSKSPTALAADRSGLVLAWIDGESDEVHLARSSDGEVWDTPIRSGICAIEAIRLVAHEGRIWLLRRMSRSEGYDVLSSVDGTEWHRAQTVTLNTSILPTLLVLEGLVSVAWLERGSGQLLAASIETSEAGAPSMLHPGPIAEPNLLEHDGELHLGWSEAATDQIHVLDRTAGGWQRRAGIHERTEGSPTLIALRSDIGVSWVRADGSGAIHLQSPSGRGIIERSRAFSGDVQGHPTALSSDHRTPFPYLGIVVLPDDWDLPKGQTEAGLTAALGTILNEVADYWLEASLGNVEITSDVHPSVVSLPSNMSTYLVRARPKLIEGSGVTFPVTLTGSKTLDLAAAGSFSMTVTLPNGSLSLNDVITAINTAIDAANYAGPADSKPIATESDIGQLCIRTVGRVDAGDALNVTGGTALDTLGLDAANRVVYEGSTTQTEQLELMLRDALKIVAQQQQDPAAFLKKYYGVVISLASNLGWYLLRANATMGPKGVSVLPGEKDFTLAHYYVTSLDPADTHAHEVGHNLGLPDQYEEGTRNVGAEPGLWDGMDSNSFSHPCAWEKAVRSAAKASASPWIDSAHVTVLDKVRQSVEVLLAPLEAEFPATNPFATSHPGVPLSHAVKVPVATGHAYYVENRQHGPYNHTHFGQVQFSRQLPGDGLIITDTVDDVAALTLSRVPVVMVHPHGLAVADVPHTAVDQIVAATTLAAKQAIIDAYVPAEIPQWLADKVARARNRDEIEQFLRSYRDQQVRNFYPIDTPGEDVLVYQFPDGDGEIRVKLLEVIGTDRPFVYRVKVTWGRQGSWFDLEIQKWQNPPPWESCDIWIDSQENGWDVYEHSDASANPDVVGNPILNGDRPWVGHDNRVKARVWNHGDIPQNNVRVDFKEVVPPGQSGGYTFDTDYIDIPAGGSAIATGIWRPRKVPANEHGCVMAQVEYRPWDVTANVVGELNANNNAAQENVSDFYVEKSSPYSTVELPFEFASPLPYPCEMKVEATGLKPGWMLRVEPYRFHLKPDERMQGIVVLEASDQVPLEDPEEGHHPPIISLQAVVRIGCTWEPIGGFSMIAHAVRRSTLEVIADPSGTGVHVAIRARDTIKPVAQANVAIGLVLDDQRMLSVTRVQTNNNGAAHAFIPVDWEHYGSTVALDVRLSPKGQSGPASVRVPLPPP